MSISKICPICEKQGIGVRQIQHFFGFRKINGVKKPQGYCHVCRHNNRVAIREKRRMNPDLVNVDMRTLGTKRRKTIKHISKGGLK